MIKFVVIVAFLVGYWAVSALLHTYKDKNAQQAKGSANAGGASDTNDQAGPAREPPPEPWHSVLGVPADAPLEHITRAYRKRIAQYHPDRVSGLAPDIVALAERESKRINAAFDVAKKLRARP